jgi:oxygen-independent coproporphyrinogen-3 oxidase
MCQFETSWDSNGKEHQLIKQFASKRTEMILDELLVETSNSIHVTEKGRSFVRNICMTLDPYLLHADPGKKMFSSTV